MISLTLDTKSCMRELLLRDTFDPFLFIEGEITTYMKFTFDGYIRKAFYEDIRSIDDPEIPSPEQFQYTTWKYLRNHCFEIIKGKRTPLDFKFIFSLSPKDIKRLIDSKNLEFDPGIVQGLYLNIRYDGQSLTCITGTSYKTFSLDKSLEQTFDSWVTDYFSKKSIKYETGMYIA